MSVGTRRFLRSAAHFRSAALLSGVAALVLALAVALALPRGARAQSHFPSSPTPEKGQEVTTPAQEAQSDYEIDVELWNRAIGSTNINALLIGPDLYLQPSDVFNFAHIKCDASADGNSFSGFYIDPARPYTIDNATRAITFQQERYDLSADAFVIRSDGGYLRLDEFEKIFNLKCIFDFRALSVELKSGEPLPAESEMKEAAARKNNLSAFGSFTEKPDETFGLQRSLFSLGTLDYSGSYQYTQGVRPSAAPAQYQLYGGGQLFGGDMDVTLQGESRQKIDWQELPWQWRYSVQNSDLVRQILIGRQDALFTTMQLPASMVGFQISNIDNSYKTSFTTYTISDHTQPDWTVELYVNDALVNYTKADQTGYYKFTLPLSYGATNIKLKFYGPYGEVRTQVEDLRIPYTFLHPGQLEYTLTGGTSLSNPSLSNSLGQLDMKMGVSTRMTVGGGVRFLGSPVLGSGTGISFGQSNVTPYGSASLALPGNILLSGEYYDGSGYRGTMNYTGPLGLSLDAEYDKPLSGRTTSSLLGTSPVTNPFYMQDQRKLTLSAPLPLGLGSLRLAATDLPMNTDSGNLALSPEIMMNVFGTSVNISANGYFLRNAFSLVPMGDATGQAGLSLMLFGGIILRPELNLDYTTRTLNSAQFQLTKMLGDWANLDLTAVRTFGLSSATSFQLALRTTLPEMQVGFTSSAASTTPISSSATVQGSIGFDAGTGFFTSNRPEVRRGGIEVIPYIDKNGDGKWDDGEPLVPKFGFARAPGQATTSDSGILRITNLEPYTPYFVQTSTANLDNISLMPKFSSFEVTPPANGFAKIEIPLASAGQIEGYVMQMKNGKSDALGGARMIVRHWEPGVDTSELSFSQDLLSYSNGEYYYMGIMPGKYRIQVDPHQLALLHATTKPAFIDFTVKSVDDGDVVEGLNFTVQKQSQVTTEESQVVK